MKTKNFLMALFVGVFLVSLASASLESLGTFQQNTCIDISQTCASCSYVNISSVSNKDNSTIVSNVGMTDLGNGEWRYEFCNTSYLGRYDVRGMGDINGVDSSFASFFEVTPSGTSFTNALSLPLFLPMILMLLITVFWFFLTGFTDRKEYKFTFILFGMLFIIFSIAFGIIASREVLYGFPLLYGFVNSFYKVFIVFASVGSIVISLIIMFHVIKTAFNTRGYNIGGKE